jgi:hypothetical protein
MEIEPSVLSNTKTNRAARYFVSGLINSKVKATLSGSQASSAIAESNPSFVFVFDSSAHGDLNNDLNQWFYNVRSPKEFLLVRLVSTRHSREITIGKSNSINDQMGIDDKYIIQFTQRKISAGVYEVEVTRALPPGEYCFLFAQGLRQGQPSKVFDFSVNPAPKLNK